MLYQHNPIFIIFCAYKMERVYLLITTIICDICFHKQRDNKYTTTITNTVERNHIKAKTNKKKLSTAI